MSSNCYRRGFTLPEMMIAIAISATLIVTFIGVIGTAEVSMSDSDRKTTQARISQEIVGELQLNEWSTILKYDGLDFYYDSEGNRLGSPVDGAGASWAYQARVEIEEEQAEAPGTESKNDDRNQEKSVPAISRKVTIEITNGAIENYDFENDNRHEVFATWVTKMNRR